MGWIRKGLTIHYCLRAESCTGELKFDSFDLDLCARFSDPSDTCINSQNGGLVPGKVFVCILSSDHHA